MRVKHAHARLVGRLVCRSLGSVGLGNFVCFKLAITTRPMLPQRQRGPYASHMVASGVIRTTLQCGRSHLDGKGPCPSPFARPPSPSPKLIHLYVGFYVLYRVVSWARRCGALVGDASFGASFSSVIWSMCTRAPRIRRLLGMGAPMSTPPQETLSALAPPLSAPQSPALSFCLFVCLCVGRVHLLPSGTKRRRGIPRPSDVLAFRQLSSTQTTVACRKAPG